jgi:hypothetical protein
MTARLHAVTAAVLLMAVIAAPAYAQVPGGVTNSATLNANANAAAAVGGGQLAATSGPSVANRTTRDAGHNANAAEEPPGSVAAVWRADIASPRTVATLRPQMYNAPPRKSDGIPITPGTP